MNTYSETMRFPSWAAFVAASREETDCHSRTRDDDDVYFRGCTNDSANKMANEGWIEGADKARRFTDALCDAIGGQIDRAVINYDVEGHNIDVARYLDNEPECWQKFDVERIQQPAVKYLRVVINGAASSGVDADTIMGRGACVAALAELLEYAGNRVEVVMALGIQARKNLNVLTTIKSFDEPLDMPKIAYALAHPSVLRLHYFSFAETFNADVRNDLHVGGSFGRPADVPKSEQGDIYLGRMMYGESQWTSPASAEAWVRDELKKFGVVLHENIPAQ